MIAGENEFYRAEMAREMGMGKNVKGEDGEDIERGGKGGKVEKGEKEGKKGEAGVRQMSSGITINEVCHGY